MMRKSVSHPPIVREYMSAKYENALDGFSLILEPVALSSANTSHTLHHFPSDKSCSSSLLCCCVCTQHNASSRFTPHGVAHMRPDHNIDSWASMSHKRQT